MKIFLTFFFFFISISVIADDITDFQIEGISIGDSLLDYLPRDTIDKEVADSRDWYYFLTYDFAEVKIRNNLEVYESVTVFVKPNDKDYLIYSIRGVIEINNLSECMESQKNASKEIFALFPNSIKSEDAFSHVIDKSGKSMVYEIGFRTKEFFVTIVCTDMTKEVLKEKNTYNNFAVSIDVKEVEDWLRNY